MSPVAKRYVNAILIGILFAIITMLLGFLPHDDLLQGIWVFTSTFVTATLTLRKRIREDDDARYTRLAKSYFKFWVKRKPSIVEGLFAANVPYSVADWFKKETNCDLMSCDFPHVMDSWSKVGDEPGELIFRAGVELGKLVEQQKQQKEKNLAEIVSAQFRAFAQKGKHLLGEEVFPKVFYKELKNGENRPVGIYLSTPEAECLALYERQEHDDETIALNKVSFGLKKEYLGEISEQEWNSIKEKIVYKNFPFFKPIGGGSGPQKKEIPLFLTEKNLSKQELEAFPQNAVKTYKEIKTFLGKDEKEEKEEEEKEEEENDRKESDK